MSDFVLVRWESDTQIFDFDKGDVYLANTKIRPMTDREILRDLAKDSGVKLVMPTKVEVPVA